MKTVYSIERLRKLADACDEAWGRARATYSALGAPHDGRCMMNSVHEFAWRSAPGPTR